MAQNQKNVTKADMISEIASRTGLNKADVKTVIETFIALVKEAIAEWFSIQLRSYGTFFRKKKASKKARNISKGTTIEIPTHETPAYKPSKEFADSIRNQ